MSGGTRQGAGLWGAIRSVISIFGGDDASGGWMALLWGAVHVTAMWFALQYFYAADLIIGFSLLGVSVLVALYNGWRMFGYGGAQIPRFAAFVYGVVRVCCAVLLVPVSVMGSAAFVAWVNPVLSSGGGWHAPWWLCLVVLVATIPLLLVSAMSYRLFLAATLAMGKKRGQVDDTDLDEMFAANQKSGA